MQWVLGTSCVFGALEYRIRGEPAIPGVRPMESGTFGKQETNAPPLLVRERPSRFDSLVEWAAASRLEREPNQTLPVPGFFNPWTYPVIPKTDFESVFASLKKLVI